MPAKTDRRVLKTQRAIREAFEALTMTHHYREITVKELAAKADINRKTFYLHYDSIDDLVESYVDYTTHTLVGLFNRRPFKESYQHPELLLGDFVALLQDHRQFFISLLMSDEYSFFARKIERNVTQELTQIILKEVPMPLNDAAICATFMIHTPLSLFRFYLSKEVPLSHAEVRNRILRLNATGLSSFFETYLQTPAITPLDDIK